MSGPNLFDRVKESTTTTGTGTLTLAGAATGFRSFGSVLADGDTTYYAIVGRGTGEWEVGLGTVGGSGTTLARTSVLASSNSNSAVSFSAGTKDVFITVPASTIVPIGSSAFEPTSISWVADVDPDAVAGSDGDALASVASGGSAHSFDQGTGGNKPLLKKGANGINSHNVIRFDGSNDFLSASTGGLSLTTTWYLGIVVRFSSVSGFQHVVCWGDASGDQHRRGLLKWGSGGPFTTNTITFNANSPTNIGDVDSTFVPTQDVACFIEITLSGGTLNIYANGTLVATGTPTLASFTAAVINVGENVGGSEPFAGDVARLWLLDSVPAAGTLGAIRSYVKSRYAIANMADLHALTFYESSTSLGPANVYQQDVGVTVGYGDSIVTTNTPLDASNTALFSVLGGFAAHVLAQEHELSNDWAEQNTIAVWNKNVGGFSAVRFRRTGSVGAEMAAVGYAVGIEPWGATTTGSLYFETSNFSDTSQYGVMRIVQTKASGSHFSKRLDMHQTGEMVWQDQQDYTSQHVTCVMPGTVQAIADSAVLTTIIPTPATGLLVVRDGTNSLAGLWRVEGTVLTAIGTLNAEWTTTKDTGSKVNVYAESNVIKVQNKTGGSLDLVAAFYGA